MEENAGDLRRDAPLAHQPTPRPTKQPASETRRVRAPVQYAAHSTDTEIQKNAAGFPPREARETEVGQSDSDAQRFGLRRPVNPKRRRPHGEQVAGTARVSLPHFGHDVSRLSSVEFGVDLCDGSGAMAQNNAGGFDAELLAEEGRSAVA